MVMSPLRKVLEYGDNCQMRWQRYRFGYFSVLMRRHAAGVTVQCYGQGSGEVIQT